MGDADLKLTVSWALLQAMNSRAAQAVEDAKRMHEAAKSLYERMQAKMAQTTAKVVVVVRCCCSGVARRVRSAHRPAQKSSASGGSSDGDGPAAPPRNFFPFYQQYSQHRQHLNRALAQATSNLWRLA